MEVKTIPFGLNLGSRDESVNGYKNMDIEKHPGVDYVGDVADLSRFSDDSINGIVASHILEHFSHNDTLDVLREWRRVLIPGKTLKLAVPDFARIVEIYQKVGIDQWLLDYLHGGQEYETAKHLISFDEKSLAGLLLKAGFSDAYRVDDLLITGCSRLISTLDGKSVSLNVEAIK